LILKTEKKIVAILDSIGGRDTHPTDACVQRRYG
jgi:hypothetical protein